MEADSLDWLVESGTQLADPKPEESAAFDYEWALTLVGEAVTAVALDFQRKHTADKFAVLRRFLPGSSLAPDYESAAAELGMTEVALRTSVSRLRQQFREVLRAAVSRTVTAPHEVDEELRYLASLLMKPGVSMSHAQTKGKESPT
jgi:RNA polymerase sigma-70 factor (ECF subfamily)